MDKPASMETETLEVRRRIEQIAFEVLNIDADIKQVDADSILTFIISESSNALKFILAIEDEFDVEFDDEELNLDFFQSFDYILIKLLSLM